MTLSRGVTLQVNVAPTDLPHLRDVLPHQLRQWAGQVTEVLLVVDLHTSPGLSAPATPEQLPALRRLIDECRELYPNIRSVDADYSAEAVARVGAKFFGGAPVPPKNWRAAPIYPYFFGLDAASHDIVFHTDSDMLYGGGSQTWIAEALSLMASRQDILVCGPLPGPPTADGRLVSQSLAPEPLDSPAFRADALSTRVFLIDLERFRDRVGRLHAVAPPVRERLLAAADGNPPFERAEVMLSRGMAASGLIRVDFLGRDPGMWSLHPPYRSQLFYERLPRLVAQVERGDVPALQRGCHDMNDSMIDWRSARKPRWKRWHKHAQLLAQAGVGQLRR